MNQFDSSLTNKSLILFVIIAIASTAIIVGGGIYWWANQKQAELNNEIFSLRAQVNQLKADKQSVTDTSALALAQAGARRYQSVHGFQIYYPKNWRISSLIDKFTNIAEAQRVGGNYFSIFSYPEDNIYNPGAPVPSNEIKIEIWVYDDVAAVSIDEWIKSLNLEKILHMENITIGNVVAKKILYGARVPYGVAGPGRKTVFYLNGNKGVKFHSWSLDTQYSQEFDDVVKTFKFDE